MSVPKIPNPQVVKNEYFERVKKIIKNYEEKSGKKWAILFEEFESQARIDILNYENKIDESEAIELWKIQELIFEDFIAFKMDLLAYQTAINDAIAIHEKSFPLAA